MMLPKKKTPEFMDLIQADIVNYKIEANGLTAGANKGSIAPGPPPAERLDLYRGMFEELPSSQSSSWRRRRRLVLRKRRDEVHGGFRDRKVGAYAQFEHVCEQTLGGPSSQW